MTLDGFLETGTTVTLGSHTFEAGEIKEFAGKYDPQPFHLDEAMAEKSVFGRLCASGWHTCAMWMRHSVRYREQVAKPRWDGPGPCPEFGPSRGFENLKWLKPVYVGDTIAFTRQVIGHHAHPSRPGWRLVGLACGAVNQASDTVLQFDSSVLVRVAGQ